MTTTSKYQALQAYNAKVDQLLELGNRLREKGREVVKAAGEPGEGYQQLSEEHQQMAAEHRLLSEEVEAEGARLLASYPT